MNFSTKNKTHMKNNPIRNALHSFRNRISSSLAVHGRLRTRRSIRLFYAVFLLVTSTVAGIAYLFHYSLRVHGATMTPGHELLMRVIFCGAALVATKVISGFEKEPWLAYGLDARHRTVHFGFGLLAGTLALSGTMAALVLTGGANVTRMESLGGSPIASGMLWALVFILVGWSEELIFRGYVFFRLARDVGAVAAAVRTSLAFGFVHAFNPNESILGLVQVVLFGLVACFAIWRTGSLWWAAGMHAAWDWSESFLFGAADSGRMVSGHFLTSQAIGPSWFSGGATGPEGSLLAIPAVGILALIVLLALPKTGAAMSLRTRQAA
ncbi:membrane protease YdiL (CAAX protease family) [Paraburkholderia sp. GAS205]|uniref:CPBP family intramembrane glutamic endopeptidase n=2 Tax=unclassified Paraburkholderia TaxID=2615204 RepID=UPI003D1B85C6